MGRSKREPMGRRVRLYLVFESCIKDFSYICRFKCKGPNTNISFTLFQLEIYTGFLRQQDKLETRCEEPKKSPEKLM